MGEKQNETRKEMGQRVKMSQGKYRRKGGQLEQWEGANKALSDCQLHSSMPIQARAAPWLADPASR